MPLLKFPRPSILLHPCVIVLLTWSTVAFLYSLHLSKLLLYDTGDVVRAFLLIVLPVLIVSSIFYIVRTRVADEARHFSVRPGPPLEVMRRRLAQCLKLWVICAVVETIVSGGVPLVWIVTSNGKANFDYGIASVHGLVNALLLALGVAYCALYLYTGRWRFLCFPAFALVWAVVLVSRGTLLVLLLEYAVIFLRLRPIRTSTLFRLVVISMIALLIFGYIGDFRSGAEAFRAVAQPTDAFPEWAPSGFLWAYIYITTPLNNLMLTMHTRTPSYNPLLPATAATLFPSVARNIIYGEETARKITQGELQSQALTVSTAYIGPFQDMGEYGIVGFSVLAGLLCEVFWHRSGFWNIFVLSVFTQALILSLFYNLLFSLPILGQLAWFYYFSRLPQLSFRTVPGSSAQPQPA